MSICPDCGKLVEGKWRKKRCADCRKKGVQARQRKYYQKPETKAKMRKYRQRPEVKAKKREYQQEYRQRPEVKAKKREYQWEYRQHPEVKAKKRELRNKAYNMWLADGFQELVVKQGKPVLLNREPKRRR